MKGSMHRDRLCLPDLTGFSFALPAARRRRLITDVGTLDKASAEKVFPAKRAYSPYAGRNFPTRPLFGDTHLHTSFSYGRGRLRRSAWPSDAYRFAKGEEVMASSGQPAKLSRPLDFLVVADHSDNMGFFPHLLAGKPAMLADPTGRRWYDMIQSGQGADAAIEMIIVAFSQGTFPQALASLPGTPAYRIRLAGDDQGGRRGERSRPLHRLHRIRVDIEYRRQQSSPQCHLPRRWVGTGEPWSSLHHGRAAARKRQPSRPMEMDGGLRGARPAGSVLAIAHNGNLSNGRMFPIIESLHRQADRPRIRRDARQMGAPLRSDPDQG